ncbi:ATPase subunit of ABC transporter with duplicated ATPase domains [Paraburkholderia sp. WC7.3d]|uniref:ATP-binding cassette domain-containing protein n=1 Tax=Paraburkholderia podalyriae TaxID=1938811 RepID=UPI0035E438AA
MQNYDLQKPRCTLQRREAHAKLADIDGYSAKSRAEKMIPGLGFTPDQLNAPLSSFSGGWRMRLNLVRALMSPSDLLLLDEPTNHLDLDAIVWFEEWIRQYQGTLTVIADDRDFLDGTCNVILHLTDFRCKRYNGNYGPLPICPSQTQKRVIIAIRAPTCRSVVD